jgi:hypothetical protein
MTTAVAIPTAVVKRQIVPLATYARSVSTLAERMQFVIGQKWVANAHAWSVAADVTPQQVTTFLNRAQANQDADMMSGTIAKLAKAASVSFEWLATGEGVARGPMRPNIVESYVAARLRERRRDGSALGKVAHDLGVDLALARRVWGGGAIAEAGRKRWPKVLGFMSFETLHASAIEWWRLKGEALHALVSPANDADEARAVANADARSLNATDQDILAVLEKHDGAGQQTREWWYERFVEAASKRLEADRAWERNEQKALAKERKVTREKQAVLRQASDRKRAPKSQRKRSTGT